MDDTQFQQISRYIEHAKQDLLSNGSEDTGALLFMGEMQDPIPRTLITDPTLSATDVRIWMLLRISIAHPGKPGKLPSQQELSQLSNCSKTTVWSSMQILRLHRWLTLCARVSNDHGMNKGNIYAIHTEPMTIGDTLRLDPDYLDFIESSLESKTGRVKNNAMATQIAFYKQINHHETSFTRSQLQQHEARLEALQPDPGLKNEGNYYAHHLNNHEMSQEMDDLYEQDVQSWEKNYQKMSNFSPEAHDNQPVSKFDTGKNVTGIKNCTRQKLPISKFDTGKNYRYQNLIPVENQQKTPVSKFDTGVFSGSSSKRLSNTTTTTTDQVKNLKSLDRLEKLILPNEIPIIRGILANTPDPIRQDVLDQVIGRLVNYQKTGQGQIFNLVSFVQALRVKAVEGTFAMDSHGLMIQNGRQAQAANRPTAQSSSPRPPHEDPMASQDPQRAFEALNAIKQSIGGEK